MYLCTKMNTMSVSQLNVVNTLKTCSRVLVESCAGSGKTTTISHIVSSFKDLNILVLCYNRSLSYNTRCMIIDSESICSTIHSFVSKFYGTPCVTDDGIYEVLKLDLSPVRIILFDILIVDECQDLTDLYSRMINKIQVDFSIEKICLFGDSRQMIYKFKGASCDFMYSDKDQELCRLDTSYRITHTMAKFLEIGLNVQIKSNKQGEKVRFVESDNRWYSVFKEVCYYMSVGYKSSDIYILSRSVKCTSAISKIKCLQTLLTSKGIFIEIPDDSHEKTPNINKNKLLISTIHGVKGMESKVVIFALFDDTFSVDLECPNEIYVALTRAKERLSVICCSNYLPCFNSSVVRSEYVDLIRYSFYSVEALNLMYGLEIDGGLVKCAHGYNLDTEVLDETTENNIYRMCPKCSNVNMLKLIDNHTFLTDNIMFKPIKQYSRKNYTISELISFVQFDLNNEYCEYIYSKYHDNITSCKKVIKQSTDIYESVHSLINYISIIFIEFHNSGKLSIMKDNEHLICSFLNLESEEDVYTNLSYENNISIKTYTIIALIEEMNRLHFTHRAFLQVKNFNLFCISALKRIRDRFNSKFKIIAFNEKFKIGIKSINITCNIDIISSEGAIIITNSESFNEDEKMKLLIIAYITNFKYNKYFSVNLFTCRYIEIYNINKDNVTTLVDELVGRKIHRGN